MTEQEMLCKIDGISQLLYQNKTQTVWETVREFLQTLQTMIQDVTQINEEVAAFSIEMLRELIENYQNQDVIGLADCMQEKVTIFMQFFYRQQKAAEEND